jgi:menaquinone-dependent protoporphyrinogen IX oxidase
MKEGENMDIIVLYKSKYGYTKKYAEWIAEELECDLSDVSKVNERLLSNYDLIIFGGGLYASGINGIKTIIKHFKNIKDKRLIVFSVGLTDPEDKLQFVSVKDKNFPDDLLGYVEVHQLRGGIDYNRLKIIDKSLLKAMKNLIEKKSEDERTDVEKILLSTYGKTVDYSDRDSIKAIIDSVRKVKK